MKKYIFALLVLLTTKTYGQKSQPFTTTWETTKPNQEIIIPTTGSGYNYSVNWGDGSEPETGVKGDATHSYEEAGTHMVTISGIFPRIYFNYFSGDDPSANATKIRSIKKWGDMVWTSMNAAFAGCLNLTSTATDAPNLSGVTDMSFMFASTNMFNEDISNWDVSRVTNMQSMFSGAIAFNGNLGKWNVSRVTNMRSMFSGATVFNRNINSWDMSRVTDTRSMFNGATEFNRNINSWDMSKVINMRSMFRDAAVFDGDLSKWNVSKVIDMASMFDGATAFNRNIGKWNVSRVTNFTDFLKGTELSPENYDALLNGWNNLDLQNNLAFHAGNSQYTSTGAAARATIMVNDVWDITDGGFLVFFPENNSMGTVTNINTDDTNRMYALVLSVDGNSNDDDNELFRIDPGTGALTFRSSPDFEKPEDANENNKYAVEVTVTESGTSSKFQLEVSVTNVNEPPVAGTMINLSLAEGFSPHVLDLSGTFTDPDAGDALMFASNSATEEVITVAIAGETLTLTGAPGMVGSSVITVTAMDEGSLAASATFTVTVSRPFITAWQTTMADESITIPTHPDSIYDYTVDWGDGTEDTGVTGDVMHTYTTANMYTVSITGTFPRIYFNNVAPNAGKIQTIKRWGDIAWASMEGAFRGCSKLTSTARDAPDLSGVTDMSSMFRNAPEFDGNLSNWDVSNVKNMSFMFLSASLFNGDLSSWNVSSVIDMTSMLFNATAFNKDLSNWDVSNVTNMPNMFFNARAFNGNISNWNVSNVTNMTSMFSGATVFNKDISKWNVSEVRYMTNMFSGATVFNKDISKWNVSMVSSMSSMFTFATAFNQDISKWNVSRVNNMAQMFFRATAFNQDISNWDVSMVTDMQNMFNTASEFNQDISNWDVSMVNNMAQMFFRATAFNQDIRNWDVSKVTDMQNMFNTASEFNQDISKWDVSKVTDMQNMFNTASEFNQDISKWDVSRVTNMAQMFGYASEFNQDISNWDVSKVTNMAQMFFRATAFDGNLGNWDVSGVTDFTNFLLNAELSSENYDALLNGWSALDLQDREAFHGGNSRYTSAGEAARKAIIDDDRWTITDGGLVDVVEAYFAENDIGTVTDINMMNDAGIVYTLADPTTGSKRDDDNAAFNINENTGVLTFKNAPNFEKPQDDNMDNRYAVEVTVTEGDTETKVAVIVSVTNVNESPVVDETKLPDLLLVSFIHNINLPDTFTDPDEDDLMIKVTSSHVGVVTAMITGTTLTLTKKGGGVSIITITATDGILMVSTTFKVKINSPPEVVPSGISDMSLEAGFRTKEIDLSGTFTDPDKDMLMLSAYSSRTDVVTVAITDGTTTLTLAEVGTGESVISVIANDGTNRQVITLFKVKVSLSFVTIWKTDMASESITIPTHTGSTYDYTVNWGDGTEDTGMTGNVSHTYTSAGMHTVTISGIFPRIYFNGVASNAAKIQTIVQWGSIEWMSMKSAFRGCSNLTMTATDKPNLSGVTDMSNMFNNATVFDGNLSNWDVSGVKNMSFMFTDAIAFNGDISDWDVSGVKVMSFMFTGATAFNENLSNWNVGNVANMGSMFQGATAFNGDISDWNVSSVTNMRSMFVDATMFNRNISRWDVSSVTDFTDFLLNAKLSPAHYDALLNGWNALDLQDREAFHGGNSRYTPGGVAARLAIMTNHGWTIADGGLLVSFAENSTGMVIDIDGDVTGRMYALANPTAGNIWDDDNALFSVDKDIGVLTFNNSPDFERPEDTNMDNTYAVEVTVTESGAPLKVAVEVSVTNVMGEPPVVKNRIADMSLSLGFGTKNIDLADTFTNPDGNALTLSVVSSNTNVVTVPGGIITSIMLTLTEVGTGTSKITVTATDGNGGTAMESFTVTVMIVTGVAEAWRGLKVYPNPVSESLTVEMEGAHVVRIYDFTGRHMQVPVREREPSKVVLDISGLTGGIYLVKVSGDGRSTVRRLVVE